MTETQILDTLDNSNYEYCSFVSLGHPYSFLIDSRINVFRSNNEQWAIAIERLGYNPRAGAIVLEIFYNGNCLINLDTENDRLTNIYSIYVIDHDNFEDTTEDESLCTDAKYWIVRGQHVPLNHFINDYMSANIHPDDFEPGKIRVEDAARFVILEHRDLFRATDKELYKSIPPALKKILVLDEWHHKDFVLLNHELVSDEMIKQTYNSNKAYGAVAGMDFDSYYNLIRKQEAVNEEHDREMWQNNRPGSYETWQLVAKVIVANDPEIYRTITPANSHWSNWPESGSL